MAKLIWTDQAINDLEDIGNYISKSSNKYAKLTIKKLYNRTHILKKFPFSGRVVPEKKDLNLREIIEGNYRIIFEIISDDLVYVLGIYHSARDLNF